MTEKGSYSNIIRTRLFRPKVVPDLILRPELYRLLDKGADCRLTLVSAPAGYGKSQLVSSWIESSDRLFSWVSLDEEMNDFALFLQHLVFSIRRLFPEACKQTLTLSTASELQSSQMVSSVLVNELMEIKTPFVLVLDDYGFIHNQDIHDLLIQLCKFTEQSLQLVLLTRRDPPFPLYSMRAKADLVEVRQANLQFTLAETAVFLEKAGNISLDDQARLLVHEKVEGWPTGLRLIILSLQKRDNINDLLREMKGDSRHVQDYLVAEILSRQSPAMREGLLKTSILRKFCALLYTALCHPDCCEQCGPECDGRFFIKKLEESNLFSVALDETGEWYRYHYLFQQLLNRTLERQYTPDEIQELHERASEWFDEQGMVEESFYHAVTVNDFESAGKLIARNRHELMNREEWKRLHYFIGKLPREIIESKPELLIQDAWVLWNRMRIGDMAQLLDRIDALLQTASIENENKDELQGEIDALRSIQYYLIPPGDGKRALFHAQRAVKNTPRHNPSTRGMAIIMLAMSYQINGRLADAFKVILEETNQREAQQNTYHTRLLITLCMIYWREADMKYLGQTAEKLLNLSTELSLQESIDIGKYYNGLVHYFRNDLEKAEQYLKDPVQGTSKVNIFNFAHSAFVLSLTYLAQGRREKAKQTADSVVQYSLDTGNNPLLSLAQAFLAELTLKMSNVSEAVRWAGKYNPEPFSPAHRYYVPQFTYARILIAQDTKKSRNKAEELLNRLYTFYLSTHHTYCCIVVLTLQAVLAHSRGKEADADKKLAEALNLAEPGGYIRLFLDLGPDMAELLERQDTDTPVADYLQQLKDAFAELASDTKKEKRVGGTADRFDNLLTNREQEILEMFARRLSNHEIADKLFIADNTVKRHATNIFRKLDVKNRRQAVAKASQLGITS